jgi:SAM-dependent methyltransferase/uncharacterized membrane protein YhdT
MVALFSTTLFLSAALLMSIQPMFAKIILPYFGGSPQVWNICMMFYQILLLGGYVFAHWSGNLRSTRFKVGLQITLVLLPAVLLPISAHHDFNEHMFTSAPIVALIVVLLSSVALPFFVLSTISPLLQKWLSYTDTEHADDPYFLYAASNMGSFIGLLSYPFLVEPIWIIEDQSLYWTVLYAVLAAGIIACGICVLRNPRSQQAKKELLHAESITTRTKLVWLLFAFIPSSAMHAVSMHMVSEVASIPLLWVVPLGVYLLTMSMCFAHRVVIPHELIVKIAPGAILLILLLLTARSFDPISLILPLHVFGLFIICMVFHGELARLRPPTESITYYYIVLAVGGALGGIFNALLSPMLFNSIVEYPLILLLSALVIPARGIVSRRIVTTRQGLLYGLIPGVFMLAAYFGLELLMQQGIVSRQQISFFGNLLVLVIPFIICYLLLHNRAAFAVGTLLCCVVGYYVNSDTRVMHAERTFFGVHTVLNNPTDKQHVLMNGITLHGLQNTEPELRSIPTAYFHPTGPIGQILMPLSSDIKRAAVVGLGIGSLAAYFRPGQELDFYEIDTAVINIAENDEYFTYISDARARGVDVKMIHGDARLTLADARDNSYDVLMMDAFTSGSIPMHLITAEAIRLYKRKLTDQGVIVFQVSNHYLDFKGPLCNLAASADFVCLSMLDIVKNPEFRREGKSNSEYLVMTHSPKALAALAYAGWRQIPPSEKRLWRDNYTNIFDAFKILQ